MNGFGGRNIGNFILPVLLLFGFASAVDTLGRPIRAYGYGVNKSLTASVDGGRVLILGGDRNVRLYDGSTAEIVRSYPGMDLYVGNIDFSPAGKKFVLGFHDSYNGGGFSALLLCDAKTGDSIASFGDILSEYKIYKFSPDESRLLVAFADKRLVLLDGSSMSILKTATTDTIVSEIGFSADGRRVIIVCGYRLPVTLWDVATLTEINRIKNSSLYGQQLFALSSDGSFIVRPCLNRPCVLNALTGDTIQAFENIPDTTTEMQWRIELVALSSDDKLIATISRRLESDSTLVEIRDIASGGRIAAFMQKGNVSYDYLKFSLDNKKIITHRSNVFQVRNIPAGDTLCFAYQAIIGEPYRDAAGAEKISTVYRDTVFRWNIGSAECVKTAFPGYFAGGSISFSTDGKKLVAANNNGIRIWETSTGAPVADILEERPASESYVSYASLSFFPNTNTFIVKSNGAFQLKDLENNTITAINGDSLGNTLPMAISNDKRSVLVKLSDRFKVYDIIGERTLCSIPRGDILGEYGLNNSALSPDGKYVLASNRHRTTLYNAVTGDSIRGWIGEYTYFAFSPTDSSVLGWGWNLQKPRLWQLNDTTPYPGRLFPDVGETGYCAAAFSSDGEKLFLNDKIFQVKSGKLLKVLKADSFSVADYAVFTPDGSQLATRMSSGNMIFLWDTGGATGTIGKPHRNENLKYGITILKNRNNELLVSIAGSIKVTPATKLEIFTLNGRLVAAYPVHGGLKGNDIYSFVIPDDICNGVHLYRFSNIPGKAAGTMGAMTLIIR